MRSQEGRRTKITTVLDSDQFPDSQHNKLVLAMAQGSESYSLPYTIDLQMYADRSLPIAPANLINTPAKVELRVENETDGPPFLYQVRKGIFQTFASQPRVHFRIPGRVDMKMYIGRLVPAFFMMAQETRYRIFENMSVIDIIKECMARFQGLDLSTYVSEASFANLAQDENLPKPIEHAVQYGESTFNFLSRLMNRASIWYSFEHDGDGPMETMVLGKGPKTGFQSCTVFRNFVDPRDLQSLGRRQPWQMLSGLARTYTPSPKLERVGEFNTVRPSAPLQSQDGSSGKHVTVVAPEANIISTQFGKETPQPDTSPNEPRTSFIQESFPDLGAFDDGDTTEDAETALLIAEAQVEVLSGVSANASFMAGRVFGLTEGEEEDLPERNYLITQMSFAAYDRNYLYVVDRNAAGGLGALLDDLFSAPTTAALDSIEGIPQPEISTVMATQALVNYVQDWTDYSQGLFSFDTYHGSKPTAAVANYSGQFANNVATAVASLGGGVVPLIWTVLQALSRVIELIIDGVLKVIAVILEGVAVAVLGIAAIVQWIMNKPTTLGAVLEGIRTVETWVEDKIHPFFRPKYIDAYSASFNAVSVARAGQPQGAGIPLPAAQKTVINGPHLATVIGPQGLYRDGGLYGVYHDKLGRVRVRFPWDRSPKGSDAAPFVARADKPQYLFGENTVWVRVSDAWAGVGFGTQFLPRVGDEVVVSFVDGDPDRPVITGRLYNPGISGFSNLPFPVPGPMKSKVEEKDETDEVRGMNELTHIATTEDLTRSGIRTQVFDKTATPVGYHILRFEDKADDSQVLLRADGRLDITAFRSMYETVHGSLHMKVVPGKDKKGNTIGGNMFTQVGGEYDLCVGGARYEDVTKEYNLTVKKDTVMDLQGAATFMVKTTAAINAHDVVIEARNQITFKVGSSFIVITPAMVQIKGAMVQINSGGSPADSPSPTITDCAGAATADPGEPWDWIKQHPPGHGGGSRTRTLIPQHGATVTMGKDGLLAVGTHGKIKVDPSDPDFANHVVSDVEKMADKDPNVASFDNPAGPTVTVRKPNPPTDPPSAFNTGDKDNKTVNYDPKDWPRQGDPSSPSSDDVLKKGLTDAQPASTTPPATKTGP